MQFGFSAEDEQFRDEMRALIRRILPDDIRERQRRFTTFSTPLEDQRRWLGLLDAEGLAVPHWPLDHGGKDWSALRRFIFEEELYMADAPEFPWIATHMVGPVIQTFGSEEQKARFLPEIRSGRQFWAQGFSEPGSGSDLVSLRTYARADGDHYVLNGQKIWTSGAFEADWGFFLVKTNLEVKPQLGISFLLVDLRSPGVTVRRIPQINGEAHLCEVFLDNVIVPADNLVGEPGQGWTYAKFLLEHERTASSFIYWNKREIARSRAIAARERNDGAPLIGTPAFRERLVRLEAEVLALEWSVLRVLAEEPSGYPPAAAASVLKLRGADLQQAITEFQTDLLGGSALRYFDPYAPPPPANDLWAEHVAGRTSIALIARAATVYGGTKQVQKNILAKIAFGL